jgi:glycosyl transferase, family 25
MEVATFIINMDTINGRGRWPRAEQQCRDAGLQCERVEGVNGSRLSAEEVRRVADPGCQTLCTTGVVGCALSHMACWRRVVERGLPMALILEDDVSLVPDFRDTMARALASVPNDWHVLVLGCFACHPVIQNTINFFGKRTQMFNNGVVRELRHFGGTHAYLVSQAGAQFLLERAPKVKYHIDIQMGRIPGIRLYGVVEDIAFQGGSTGTSEVMSAGFPGSVNMVLSAIGDSKGVGLDYWVNASLLRVGPYDGPHVVVTLVIAVFLALGLTGVSWRWVLGLSALDMLLFPPTSAKSPVTALGAYGLGYGLRAGLTKLRR